MFLKQVLGTVKRVLPFYFFTFLPFSIAAQDIVPVRGDCMPELKEATAVSGKQVRRLPAISRNWDPNRIYRQAVILVEFSDFAFSLEKPRETYDSIFNHPGFNRRNGAGCVADYYRDQSKGLFNVQFDVYGPIKVNRQANPIANPTKDTRNYGYQVFIEAAQKTVDSLDVDFSPYDWNGNGNVNQVIYIYAGFTGNQGENEKYGKSYGYIWPNTSTHGTVTDKKGTKISAYSCSGELWLNHYTYGIGTICHEYTHSLGLPDIYPTGGSTGYASVVDEWDLMDGGNFTNWGWCPCNLTAMEKMLLGWLTPVELNEPATITNLKPVSEGGEAYMVKQTDNEYLLMENRQYKGWDVGIPGRGLVIYHVDYDASKWSSNSPNSEKGHFRFDLVHADNRDYNQWDDLINDNGMATYAVSPRLHNRHLSTSSYPWIEGDNTNKDLTDNTLPATTMYNNNANGSKLLAKSITNITMDEAGLISFDFMGGGPTVAIRDIGHETAIGDREVYDLTGRKVTNTSNTLLIVREKNCKVRKIFSR